MTTISHAMPEITEEALGELSRDHLGPEDYQVLDEVIAHLETTPEESWWAGPTYRSPDGTQHCALSHIEVRHGMQAMDLFEEVWSSSTVIGLINDGKNPRYPQATAKARSLAFLQALRAGDEQDTHTSMEANWRGSTLAWAYQDGVDEQQGLAAARESGLSGAAADSAIITALRHWSRGEWLPALRAVTEAGISHRTAFRILAGSINQATTQEATS